MSTYDIFSICHSLIFQCLSLYCVFIYSYDESGFIKTDDLGTVLRGLNKNVTEAQLSYFINSYDSDGSGKLDFPTFYKIIVNHSPMKEPLKEAQVLQHFHVFDIHRDGNNNLYTYLFCFFLVFCFYFHFHLVMCNLTSFLLCYAFYFVCFQFCMVTRLNQCG